MPSTEKRWRETAMNAEVRPIKTRAETALAANFAVAKRALPGAAAVAALREDAFRRFESDGLPHRRVEEWKYTDLRALMRDAKPLAGAPDAEAKARAKSAGNIFAAVDARRIVLVDGALVPELSDLAGLEPGLRVHSLADALGHGSPELTERLATAGPAEGDVAYELNTAFMGDGAIVEVAAGVQVARPLHLVFVYGSQRPAAVFSRS